MTRYQVSTPPPRITYFRRRALTRPPSTRPSPPSAAVRTLTPNPNPNPNPNSNPNPNPNPNQLPGVIEGGLDGFCIGDAVAFGQPIGFGASYVVLEQALPWIGFLSLRLSL